MEADPKSGGTPNPLWKIPYFFLKILLNPSLTKPILVSVIFSRGKESINTQIFNLQQFYFRTYFQALDIKHECFHDSGKKNDGSHHLSIFLQIHRNMFLRHSCKQFHYWVPHQPNLDSQGVDDSLAISKFLHEQSQKAQSSM